MSYAWLPWRPICRYFVHDERSMIGDRAPATPSFQPLIPPQSWAQRLVKVLRFSPGRGWADLALWWVAAAWVEFETRAGPSAPSGAGGRKGDIPATSHTTVAGVSQTHQGPDPLSATLTIAAARVFSGRRRANPSGRAFDEVVVDAGAVEVGAPDRRPKAGNRIVGPVDELP